MFSLGTTGNRLRRLLARAAFMGLTPVLSAQIVVGSGQELESTARAGAPGSALVLIVTAGEWCDPCAELDEIIGSARFARVLRQTQVRTVVAHEAYAMDAGVQVDRLPAVLAVDRSLRTQTSLDRPITYPALQAFYEAVDSLVSDGNFAAEDETAFREFVLGTDSLRTSDTVHWESDGVAFPRSLRRYDEDDRFWYVQEVGGGVAFAIEKTTDLDAGVWRWNGDEARWIRVPGVTPRSRDDAP